VKDATFFFRGGGIIVTQIADSHTGTNIGQRLAAGGFIVGRDSFWGRVREVPINLSDVVCVMIYDSSSSVDSGKGE